MYNFLCFFFIVVTSSVNLTYNKNFEFSIWWIVAALKSREIRLKSHVISSSFHRLSSRGFMLKLIISWNNFTTINNKTRHNRFSMKSLRKIIFRSLTRCWLSLYESVEQNWGNKTKWKATTVTEEVKSLVPLMSHLISMRTGNEKKSKNKMLLVEKIWFRVVDAVPSLFSLW